MRYPATAAFILHTRPYRESSLLVDVFSEQHGRLHVLARGARSVARRALLQPFRLLQMTMQGRTDLLNLTTVDALSPAYALKGDALLSGFYLNELLVRLVHKQDPTPLLFSHYRQALQALCTEPTLEKSLRFFEKNLLTELGYGIQFENVDPALSYLYSPGHGFKVVTDGILGAHLLSFAKESLPCEESLKSAKRLMRTILSDLLGDHALHSRKLFQKVSE